MKHIIVVISLFFFLMTFNTSQAQDFKFKRETIYLLFEENNGEYPKFKCLKFKNEDGINFNLCQKGALIYNMRCKSDTMSIDLLDKYKISTSEDIDKKILNFRKQTYGKFPKKKNDKLYQAYDNNDLFKTYLIEIIENDKRFVIYPVSWRNQGIIE